MLEPANSKNSRQIRILKSLLSIIDSRYDSYPAGLNRILTMFDKLEYSILQSLHHIFTRDEITALVENAYPLNSHNWGSKKHLLFELENYFMEKTKGQALGAPQIMRNKINGLSDAQFLVLQEMIYRYWSRNPTNKRYEHIGEFQSIFAPRPPATSDRQLYSIRLETDDGQFENFLAHTDDLNQEMEKIIKDCSLDLDGSVLRCTVNDEEWTPEEGSAIYRYFTEI